MNRKVIIVRSLKRSLSCYLYAIAPLILRHAVAAPPANFDDRVESLRKQVGVPGIAIAIVENGKVTLAKGYGARKLGAPEPVDADTIFPTGSTGKAFTVADLGILVDQKKIDWDDKVIDHLPEFQMYDPWVTREMTIRDLLVHRSGLGLGEGDLLFVPRSNLSRAEVVTEEHILKPAGMLHSTSDDPPRFANADRAYPHARMNGGLRGIGDQEVLDERDDLARNAAPAGGLAISANDFARWLLIQLEAGKLPDGDGRLFSEAAHEQMWKPVLLQPNRPRPTSLQPTQPMFYTYALGWDVQDYRGAKIVWHGGAVFGFQAAVVLIPEKNVGFSIEINSEDGEVILGLMDELLDHYLGLPKGDWPEKMIDYKKQMMAEGLKKYQTASAKPVMEGPSLSLAGYAGTYVDPWYGNIEIGNANNKLTIDFKSTPRMSGTLDHWQYDTFITRFTDKAIEPAYVTFSLDAEGKIDRITMKPVSPLADFSWDYQDLLFRPTTTKK